MNEFSPILIAPDEEDEAFRIKTKTMFDLVAKAIPGIKKSLLLDLEAVRKQIPRRGSPTHILFYDANGILVSNAGLTYDPLTQTFLLGNGTLGGLLTLAGKTGSTNNYVFDTGTTAGTLEIRLSSGVERFVSLVNSGAGVLSLLVDGKVTASSGLIFGGGGTTLNHYEEGTFTATLTGCTTSPTVTARYVRIGSAVSLYIPAVSATSNTTACTITGVPSPIRPARSKYVPVLEVRDNGNSYPGGINVETGGALSLLFHSAIPGGATSVFTNANAKGLTADTDITYNLS